MMTEPTEAMGQCDMCGKQWPSAAQGVIHKCTCTGGMCSPMNAAPDIHRAAPTDAVEAVARAICNADGEDPDLDLAGPNGRSGIPNWHPYRNLARAALAAIPIPATGEVEQLEAAARCLCVSAVDYYTARNGKRMGVQDDSGEKCWIVTDDDLRDLERAVAALADHTTKDTASDKGEG